MLQKTENLFLHVYTAEVTVERVNIQIKFPCSVSSSLRIGKQQSFCRQAKLANGLAEFNQRVQVQTELIYDKVTKQYSLKKVSRRLAEAAIYVHIISQTGKNTAGVCYLDLVEVATRPPYDLIKRPLERCPDHSAEISYRIRLKFQQELPYQQNEGSLNDIGKQPSQGKNSRTDLAIVRESSEFTLMNSNSRNRIDPFPKPPLQPVKEIRRQPSISALTNRIITQGEGDPNWRNKTRIPSQFLGIQRNSSAEKPSPPFPPTSSYNSTTSRVGKPSHQTLLEVERRAARLQAQRDSQLKQMVTLNSQMEVLRAQLFTKSAKELELNAELQRIKRKCENQDLQIQGFRKNQQKTGRMSDKVSEELVQKLSRMGDLEQEVRTLRTNREIAEKALKQKARQTQELTQKLDDLTNSQATLQKRLDLKDSFYKEQMKKYSQRLVECELQKQKMMNEQESLKGLSEDKQRRIQSLIKERDKLVQQEKVKLNKKYDLLRQQFEKLSCERLTERQQMLNSSSTVERLKGANAQSNLQKIRLEQEIERLKNKLVAQTFQKSKYQEELKEKSITSKMGIIKQLEADRKEKHELLDTVQRQLDQKSEQNRQLTDKNLQLQKRLKDKEIRVSDQQFEIDSLKKRSQSAKRSIDKKMEEWAVQEASFQDQITSFQQIRGEYESLARKYEHEIDDLKVTNSHLMAEINEKTHILNELQNSSLRASSNSLRLQQKVKQLGEQTQSLSIQINHLRAVENELLEKLKKTVSERDDIRLSHELNEKLFKKKENALVDMQSQVDVLKQKLSETECMMEDSKLFVNQLSIDLQTIKKSKEEKNRQIGEVRQSLQAASTQVIELTKKLQVSNQQIQQMTSIWKRSQADNATLTSELQSQKLSNKALKHKNSLTSSEFNLVRQEARSISKQLDETLGELTELRRVYSSVQQQLRTTRSEFDTYRNNTTKCLNSYSELLLKQEPPTAAQLDLLVQSCDISISQILIEILRKYSQNKGAGHERHKHSEEAIKQLKQLNSQAKRQLHLMGEEITNLGIEIDLKEEEKNMIHKTAKLREEQLQIELQNMKQEQVSLEQNWKGLAQRYESLQQQFQKLQLQKQEIQRMFIEALSDAQQLRSDLDHSQKKQEYLQAQMDSAHLQFTSQSQTLISLRVRTLAQQGDFEKQLNQAQLDLAEKSLKIQKLQQSSSIITILHSEIEQLKSSLNEANERQFTNSVQIEDLQQKLKSSIRKERELAERANEAQQKMLDQETKMSQLQLGELGLGSRIRDTQQLLKKSEKQRESLIRRLAQSEADLQNNELVVNCMRGDMQTAQQQLDQALNNLRSKDNYLSMIQDQLASKSKQQNELTHQLTKLRDAHSRISNQLKIKQAQFDEIGQLNTSELKELTKVFESLNLEHNILKEQLLQEQNTIQGLKKAYEKERQQWQYKEKKLDEEVMELNEQLYSISSDVNTMKLKQEEDQETMEKLEQQNNTVLNLYLAEKKRNDIANQNSQKSLGQDRRVQELQKQIQDLRIDVIKRTEQVQRLTSENQYLQNQVIDNPMVKQLQEKSDQMARGYQEQLMVMQQMLNRERTDSESLRRDYHQKCISYQQKIRALDAQFRSNNRQTRQSPQRLETIEEEQKSSTMSQIGRCPSEGQEYNISDQDEVRRLTKELKRKSCDVVVYEQQTRQLEQTILKLQTQVSLKSADLEALQQQIKRSASQKIYQSENIHEINNIVNRIKAKCLVYCRIPAQNKDLVSQLKLLQLKISDISVCGRDSSHLKQSIWQHEDISPTQSTDIIDSSSLNDLRRAPQQCALNRSTSPRQMAAEKIIQKNRY